MENSCTPRNVLRIAAHKKERPGTGDEVVSLWLNF